MEKISLIALDLLCKLTFEPIEEIDPEELADIQTNYWQTLIHDLSNEEKQSIKKSAQFLIENLTKIHGENLPENAEIQIGALQAYIDDEME